MTKERNQKTDEFLLAPRAGRSVVAEMLQHPHFPLVNIFSPGFGRRLRLQFASNGRDFSRRFRLRNKGKCFEGRVRWTEMCLLTRCAVKGS